MNTTITADLWTVFLGNGLWSHAAVERDAPRTLCGRSTANVREWMFIPGNQPGCNPCYRRFRERTNMTSQRRIFHVTTSDGGTYGVAASGKTEAKEFVQTRLTADGSDAHPVTSTYVGTSPGWTFGLVLRY